MRVQSLGQEDPLEEEMATHSSILAWDIPWTEESAGLVWWVTKSQIGLRTPACARHCFQCSFCINSFYLHSRCFISFILYVRS